MRSSVGQSRGTSRQLRCIHSMESLIVLISSQGKTMLLFKMLWLIIQEVTLSLRRADFGFSGGARTILVDCTTISPLAKIIKDYKPGEAADYATKRKEKYYQRFLDIKTTDRCAIFFFAVETSGGLGREARNYVKMLANFQGTDGFTIMRIYQTLPWKSKRLGPIKSTSRRISR
jgi:hypothetical protein